MDVSRLDDWMRQLDYFYKVQQLIDKDKVVFAKLLMCKEALLWWDNLCECRVTLSATQALMCGEFNFSIKDKFCLVNYWKEQQITLLVIEVQQEGRCLHLGVQPLHHSTKSDG